ncbi:MAG: hypothetical protein OEY93_07450 [Anaerolineae bacterium]|nr:hypothetical protein [Anaerolineae bacterium]
MKVRLNKMLINAAAAGLLLACGFVEDLIDNIDHFADENNNFQLGPDQGEEQSSIPVKGFIIQPVPARFDGFEDYFSQYINVFGVHVFASNDVPSRKILHAANILAEYLDNDQDGIPDDPNVIKEMRSVNAALVMFGTSHDLDSSGFLDQDEIIDRIWMQDLAGDEVIPGGSKNGEFDASIEEVLHLISSAGWEQAYPKVFGARPGTLLGDRMDIARGGQFMRVPDRYPKNAWYTYYDETCEYECQVSEYFYWALTSILGGQDFPGRLGEIREEWPLNTREKVREGDPGIYQLLTDPKYNLPTNLPDGSYSP